MKHRYWTALFIVMTAIAFSAIILAFQQEELYSRCWARMQYGLNMDRKAPSDIMQGGELRYNENRVTIEYNITHPCWAGGVQSTIEYGNGSTTSMIPTISYGHQALCLTIKSLDCIQEGDIVVNKESGNTHRVIEKGSDENGTYLLTIGDNNFDYSDYDVTLRKASGLCVVFGVIY